MGERQKVIDALEHCILNHDGVSIHPCKGCPYQGSYDCADKMKSDCLELLKEQEPVKPKYNARTNWYECGACHYSMTSGMHCRNELIPAYKVGFCAKCGREQTWNA